MTRMVWIEEPTTFLLDNWSANWWDTAEMLTFAGPSIWDILCIAPWAKSYQNEQQTSVQFSAGFCPPNLCGLSCSESIYFWAQQNASELRFWLQWSTGLLLKNWIDHQSPIVSLLHFLWQSGFHWFKFHLIHLYLMVKPPVFGGWSLHFCW